MPRREGSEGIMDGDAWEPLMTVVPGVRRAMRLQLGGRDAHPAEVVAQALATLSSKRASKALKVSSVSAATQTELGKGFSCAQGRASPSPRLSPCPVFDLAAKSSQDAL